MSSNRRCYLYVTNNTDETFISAPPTDVVKHVVKHVSEIPPHSKDLLVLETKGTSGTATGSYVTDKIYPADKSGYVEISISCPWHSDNSYKISNYLNPNKYIVTSGLQSKSGNTIVHVTISPVSSSVQDAMNFVEEEEISL
ncbi:aegerolysin family protein [Vibrio quintilis]|uniref:Uncharacterized protein n=1 Tax=Vibrio quintilis TaxID=1117707 RepID=A0A1M7YP28_9VIBR|nr:aegerolysin family protein [Vibrio quintilis]SHO54394.1 hypothetical protein VQ7734_00108 [Vibrio quintilis]